MNLISIFGDYAVIVRPFAGGIIIGLASWLLWVGLGRIAGISGIVSGILIAKPLRLLPETAWRMAFILGLIMGGLWFVQGDFSTLMGVSNEANNQANRPIWMLLVAGLLVGFGTVKGSGCTSGHGVCGLGRRSKRSLVATLTFMTTGVLTASLIDWVMWSVSF